MKQKVNNSAKPFAQISVCLALLLFISLNCTLPNKPWRNYEQQPFDSQKWRDGDALDRGTMIGDLYTKRKIQGKTREQVLELLGEPDKKSNQESFEIWHYKMEFSGEEPIQYFPVTFDGSGKTGIGSTRKR